MIVHTASAGVIQKEVGICSTGKMKSVVGASEDVCCYTCAGCAGSTRSVIEIVARVTSSWSGGVGAVSPSSIRSGATLACSRAVCPNKKVASNTTQRNVCSTAGSYGTVGHCTVCAGI